MAISATPFLMFEGEAQAAMDLYTSLFQDSQVIRAERYAEGEPGPAGTIKVATFTLCNREYLCSDSPAKHDFSFTPANSIFVECESKEELEHVFITLSQDGQVFMPLDNYGFSQCFGWVSDRFGVSWQLNLAAG